MEVNLKPFSIEGLFCIRHAHYDTGELTIALESDVEQSVVRGDALFWKWLVEKRHNSVVAVDGMVHSTIPEVDTKPEDWEETIWGTDPSEPEVFMYVASILMDVAPVAGTVKSVIELFTGRDLITNEEIPLWLAAGGVIGSFVPGGKGAVRGVAKVLKGGGKAKLIQKWTPINGPGPLGKSIAETFKGATYSEKMTEAPLTLYRTYGGTAEKIGPFWTRTKPKGSIQSMMDSALDPAWGNTAEKIATIKIPKGINIYEGSAAKQGNLIGGGNQIFIKNVNPQWIIK